MIGEYRTARGWRIFIYIASPLLILVFVFLGVFPFKGENFSWTIFSIFLPMSFGGVALFTYALLDTIKGRLIITSDSFYRQGVLKTNGLAFSEVKGFRVDTNYIHILPNITNKKSIKITAYIEKS